jgi:microcystin-dependent protein
MASSFLGQILLVPYNFAPRGYAFCSGQLLSIQQNSALFSLLGTTYGGNGVTTFALPDLRGRVPISAGQGLGLSPYTLGEQTGSEAHTLITTEIPQHNHAVFCSTNAGTQQSPQNGFPAPDQTGNAVPYGTPSNSNMNPAMIGMAGGSQPDNNLQPLLVLNYVIALVGIFPSRT